VRRFLRIWNKRATALFQVLSGIFLDRLTKTKKKLSLEHHP